MCTSPSLVFLLSLTKSVLTIGALLNLEFSIKTKKIVRQQPPEIAEVLTAVINGSEILISIGFSVL